MKIRVKSIHVCMIAMSLFTACSNDKVNTSQFANVVHNQTGEILFNKIPDSAFFCGKRIPLNDFDVKERMDRELIVNTYYHSATIQLFKRAHRYLSLIENILKKENIPDDFKYLCMIESGLNQSVSPSGAAGFWQLMPSTAIEYGLTINQEVDERFNIEKSTVAACNYLRKAHAKFNDWILAAASYNRGMNGIEKSLDDQEVDTYFDLLLNDETSRYVFRILAIKQIFEHPEQFNFRPDLMELYAPIETNFHTVSESISNLKHWAITHGSNFKMLKLLNPWILSDQLTVNSNNYVIKLPK